MTNNRTHGNRPNFQPDPKAGRLNVGFIHCDINIPIDFHQQNVDGRELFNGKILINIGGRFDLHGDQYLYNGSHSYDSIIAIADNDQKEMMEMSGHSLTLLDDFVFSRFNDYIQEDDLKVIFLNHAYKVMDEIAVGDFIESNEHFSFDGLDAIFSLCEDNNIPTYPQTIDGVSQSYALFVARTIHREINQHLKVCSRQSKLPFKLLYTEKEVTAVKLAKLINAYFSKEISLSQFRKNTMALKKHYNDEMINKYMDMFSSISGKSFFVAAISLIVIDFPQLTEIFDC